MTDTPARLAVAAGGASIEITGAEAFVTAQAKALEPMIRALLEGSPAAVPPGGGKPNEKDPPPPGALAEYHNVLADADGQIQLLKPLPGNGKAEKTVSAALLCLFGNSLRGVDEVPFDTIRTLCEAHSCLDSGNFSKTLKADKNNFICTGSRRAQKAKLTVPGKRAAQTLAQSLNSA